MSFKRWVAELLPFPAFFPKERLFSEGWVENEDHSRDRYAWVLVLLAGNFWGRKKTFSEKTPNSSYMPEINIFNSLGIKLRRSLWLGVSSLVTRVSIAALAQSFNIFWTLRKTHYFFFSPFSIRSWLNWILWFTATPLFGLEWKGKPAVEYRKSDKEGKARERYFLSPLWRCT